MAVRELVPLLVIGGVFLLCRYAGLKLWHAVLVLTGGFYLASSALGPGISQVLSRIPGPVRLALIASQEGNRVILTSLFRAKTAAAGRGRRENST